MMTNVNCSNQATTLGMLFPRRTLPSFLCYFWATQGRKISFLTETAIEAKGICSVMNTGVLSIPTRASNLFAA
jgi:hypothetical protein